MKFRTLTIGYKRKIPKQLSEHALKVTLFCDKKGDVYDFRTTINKMIANRPAYISIIFGLTTVATLALFFWTIESSSSEIIRQGSTKKIVGLSIWLIIQAVLTFKGIYSTNTDSVPPKIATLGILPASLIIFLLFTLEKGKDSLLLNLFCS